MTEKELRKLGRQDLLRLLLIQSKEVSRLKKTIEKLKDDTEQEQEHTATLKTKLDEKDETIEQLRLRLDAKDETVNRLMEEARRMTAAVELLRSRLNEKDAALDAAQARLKRLSSETDDRTPDAWSETADDEWDPEKRLQYLKKQLAESKAMAEQLRKGKK